MWVLVSYYTRTYSYLSCCVTCVHLPPLHCLHVPKCSIFVILNLSVGATFFVSLSFGAGFPKTLTCSLFNTSCVPMAFTLRVLGDGLGSPSVNYNKQLSDTSRSDWQASPARNLHARPAEFTISPAAGSVLPKSDVTIEVQLINTRSETQ